MDNDFTKYRFSSEEVKCLRDAVSSNQSLLDLLDSAERGCDGSISLRIERKTVEKLSNDLTLQLAKIGFTADYSLTKEGEILEGIIDRLFYLTP